MFLVFMKYNIYAGLSGSFGGATYRGTLECEDIMEAEQYAYECALEEYESYSGCHGLLTWDDIAEENNLDINENSVEIDCLYTEQLEDWIEYYVTNFDEDPIDPQEYYE